jgi:hypothetical protein
MDGWAEQDGKCYSKTPHFKAITKSFKKFAVPTTLDAGVDPVSLQCWLMWFHFSHKKKTTGFTWTNMSNAIVKASMHEFLRDFSQDDLFSYAIYMAGLLAGGKNNAIEWPTNTQWETRVQE